MDKVSVVISSRNEQFLQKTINEIFDNAIEEIEVIVILDGYWPQPAIKDRKNLTFIHRGEARGMRDGINSAVNIAKGKYIMKCDAHCMFAKGFDLVLKKDCDKDWVVIPRRYSLDGENWKRDETRPVRDAHYISHPLAFINDNLGFGLHIKDWHERAKQRKDIFIDDEMASQGSCWFMHKDYFIPLSEKGYGTFIQEFQEIGLRTWLSGGRVVVNKNTWYAHLWKGKKYGRGYPLDRKESKLGEFYSADFWFNNRLPNRIHDFEWLIDKFWPIPTWQENWKDIKIDFEKYKLFEQKTIEQVTFNISKQDEEEQKVEIIESEYDKTLNFLLKKFNCSLTDKMPIGLPNYTREQDMAKLFCELGYKTGAEIGVKKGEFSELLCIANPKLKMFCVDPWEPYGDYWNYLKPGEVEGFYPNAKKRLSKYNCELIRKYSLDAVKDFEDNSLDFVYIDANHKYEYVVADIAAWEKKVRPGGMISGHDYKIFWKYNPVSHIYEAVNGYTQAYRIAPWFIFQTRIVDKNSKFNRAGSFMWVKK